MIACEWKAKLHMYRELKERQAEVQAALATLEEEFKAEMGDEEEIDVEGIKVRWTRYTTRRFDTTAFKAEHAALYEQYAKAVQGRRFSVT